MQAVTPTIYGLTASFTAPYIATLTGTLTADRTYTFPNAAITVAGIDYAQTWTADQTFDVIKTNHCDAATSAGVHVGNLTHQDVAIFGAGGGQGSTFYGQINGTSLVMSGAASCASLTAGSAATGRSVILNSSNADGSVMVLQNSTVEWGYVGSYKYAIGSGNANDLALMTIASGSTVSVVPNGFVRLTVSKDAPGTPSAGQVLIGGGEVKAAGAISCTALATSLQSRKVYASAGTTGTPVVEEAFTGGFAPDGTYPSGMYVANAFSSGAHTWLKFKVTNAGATADALTLDRTGAATFAAGISCTTLTASGAVRGLSIGFTNGASSWDIGASGAGLLFYDNNTASTRLTISPTGAATFAAGISCTTLTAIGGSAPSSGVSGVTAWQTSNIPLVALVDSSRGADAKIWDMRVSSGELSIECVLDNYSASFYALKFARSGSTPGAATFASSIEGPKVKLTPEGGLATLVVADEAISVGHVCAIIQGGTANRVKKCPTTGDENDMPVGVAYSAAAGAGSSFWMVVSGRVGVLPDTGVTAAQGYILTTSSTTAGLIAQAAAAPAAATHFKEVGHFINTGSGAGVITDAIVHFN